MRCCSVWSEMIPLILYLSTGLATAGLVVYNLSLVVWGAPTSPLEFISLVGSAGLIGAALVSRADRKRAGRIALCSMMMIWSFFAPAIVQSERALLTGRQLTVKAVKWKPSAAFINDTAGSSILTEADLKLLDEANLRGNIWGESSIVTGRGPSSEVLLLIRHPVTSKVELLQPKAGTVLYIQTEAGWRLWPEGAETLKRVIRLEPYKPDPTLPIPADKQANQTSVSIEQADGSTQGFGINWEAAR